MEDALIVRVVDHKECEWSDEPDIHGIEWVFNIRASGYSCMLWEEAVR